jgi:hypothetical protein
LKKVIGLAVSSPASSPVRPPRDGANASQLNRIDDDYDAFIGMLRAACAGDFGHHHFDFAGKTWLVELVSCLGAASKVTIGLQGPSVARPGPRRPSLSTEPVTQACRERGSWRRLGPERTAAGRGRCVHLLGNRRGRAGKVVVTRPPHEVEIWMDAAASADDE